MSDELLSKLVFYTHFHSQQNGINQTKSMKATSKEKTKPKKQPRPVETLRRALVAPNSYSSPVAAKRERFYLTTAINYTNGLPHLGHAYEGITSDAVARYHRLAGREVFFLTGTDEHGQKVEQSAAKLGKSPQEVADFYAEKFRLLNEKLCISNDGFIRTTDPVHEEVCRRIWELVKAKGDIYLKPYVGWYDVNAERYIKDSEAKQMDYKDEFGRPFEKKEEESYFFRMGKYHAQLAEHIEENPNFIMPESRRQEIISFLKEPLHDLCISRTVCQWGVKCPEDAEYAGSESHVMYVWFDALTNYLSGIGYLLDGSDPRSHNAKFWPVDVHIIGKDIIRFHCVYWPCMLMSAGIPLPKSIFGHGFVNDKDGVKMSKSLENVVDPWEMINKYNVDCFRFYLTQETSYGTDLAFNEHAMVSLFNAVLSSGLGNLVHRSTSLCKSYCNGEIPAEAPYKLDGKLPFDLNEVLAVYEKAFSINGQFQIQQAGEALVSAINAANKYLQDAAPWHLKGDEHASTRRAMVRTALEAVYVLAHLVQPFCPERPLEIFEKLGVKGTILTKLNPDLTNLVPGTQTYVGEVLYEQMMYEIEEKKNEDVKPDVKKEKKIKEKKAEPAKKAESEDDLFYKIDIRVGKIVKVWHHEEAEQLFCEHIDVGEDKPREIASGLRKFYNLEEMEGKLVLAICNLKPANLKGFKSHGMVLCAAIKGGDDEKVEFCEPPAGSKVGERVFLQGEADVANLPDPDTPNAVTKKKIFAKVAEHLVTNDACEGTFNGKKLMTSAGVCKAKTLVRAKLT